MNKPNTPKKLTRAQIKEGLDSVPIAHILGSNVSRELTHKQKTFAMEVAKGSTKASAYRKAYNVKSKHVIASEPYKLSSDQRISREIEAYKAAIEAERYRTPAALRSLVIQSLVQVIIDPDSKPGQVTAAAKVLGTVTEVAAFTERKEVRTITSSEDARAKLMQEIKALTKATAIDAQVIEAQASSLMDELAAADPHPSPTPTVSDLESHSDGHTIPLEQTSAKSIFEQTQSPLEQSPSSPNQPPQKEEQKFPFGLDSGDLQEPPPSSFG